MNKPKEKESNASEEVTKKCCSKAKDGRKSTAGTDTRKYGAHSGIKFNFNPKKKVTTVKPFSFDSNAKSEKAVSSHTETKSAENGINEKGKDSTDSGREIKVLMDTLKISRSTECKSKEKSPVNEKTPAKHPPCDKKACNRCSRAIKSLTQPPKESKSQVMKDTKKVSKSQQQSVKTTKTQTSQQSSKTVSTQCSKTRKIQESSTSVKTLTVSKSKTKIFNTEKVASNVQDIKNHKPKDCKLENSEDVPTNAPQPEFCGTNMTNSESGFTNGDKTDVSCHDTEMIECVTPIPESIAPDSSNREKSELPNGSTPQSERLESASAPMSELVNETSSEPDSSNGTKHDSSPAKSASKIPRKTSAAQSGMKSHSSIKKENVTQSLSFENRCPNVDNQLISIEENAVIN